MRSYSLNNHRRHVVAGSNSVPKHFLLSWVSLSTLILETLIFVWTKVFVLYRIWCSLRISVSALAARPGGDDGRPVGGDLDPPSIKSDPYYYNANTVIPRPSVQTAQYRTHTRQTWTCTGPVRPSLLLPAPSIVWNRLVVAIAHRLGLMSLKFLYYKFIREQNYN